MINLLLFGAGVYVRGSFSNKDPLGNIGASLIEGFHRGLISKVFIKSSSSSSCQASAKINHIAGFELAFSCRDNLLDEDFLRSNNIHAAIIALPDHLHYPYLKRCAQLELHAITVKPFVESLQQAEELCELYKSKNLFGFIEFHKRFDKHNILLKNDIKGSCISRILIDYSQDLRVPTNDFRKWSSYTNVFQYLGVHYVDLVHWMTKAEPVRISTYASGSHLSQMGLRSPDNVDVVIEWVRNCQSFTSIHLTSWAESHGDILPSRQSIQVLTNNSRIELDQANRGYVRTIDGNYNIVNPYFSREYIINRVRRYSGYGIDNYLAFFELINNSIETPSFSVDERLCSFESALLSVMVTEKVSSDIENA